MYHCIIARCSRLYLLRPFSSRRSTCITSGSRGLSSGVRLTKRSLSLLDLRAGGSSRQFLYSNKSSARASLTNAWNLVALAAPGTVSRAMTARRMERWSSAVFSMSCLEAVSFGFCLSVVTSCGAMFSRSAVRCRKRQSIVRGGAKQALLTLRDLDRRYFRQTDQDQVAQHLDAVFVTKSSYNALNVCEEVMQ